MWKESCNGTNGKQSQPDRLFCFFFHHHLMLLRKAAQLTVTKRTQENENAYEQRKGS